MMLRSTFLIGTTVFWLVMTSLLIQREFFQLTPIRASYEVLPILTSEMRREYRGIYLGDELIGFNLTTLESTPASKGTSFDLGFSSYLTFLFLGQEREMLVRGTAILDKKLELQSFKLKITSGDYWTEMEGQIAKNNLNLVIQDRAGAPFRKILPVQRPLFFSEALPMIWTPENLKPGKRGSLTVWNPLLMNFENIEFRVGPKVTIPYEDKSAEVFVIDLLENEMETRYFATPVGVVLKHESPTGLVMRKQPAWKIFDSLREKRRALSDLPNLYSIPSNRELKNPDKLAALTVQLKTPDGDQTLTIRRAELKPYLRVSWPLANPDAELIPFLMETEFIQADHPAIRRKAKEIIGGEKSAILACRKILDWVHAWVSPVPTMSFPSALQVMELRKGDCNEYTALFTALTRSLGIPTKMVAGLVYQRGRFFYHAWPEIFAGQWIGFDPTFGQVPNDVTHIPLVEGGLEEQINLIRKLGRINVIVLEAK